MDKKLRILQRKAQTGDTEDLLRYIHELERFLSQKKTTETIHIWSVAAHFMHPDSVEIIGSYTTEKSAEKAAIRFGKDLLPALDINDYNIDLESLNNLLEVSQIGTLYYWKSVLYD